jgi:hypothetical protein
LKIICAIGAISRDARNALLVISAQNARVISCRWYRRLCVDMSKATASATSETIHSLTCSRIDMGLVLVTRGTGSRSLGVKNVRN